MLGAFVLETSAPTGLLAYALAGTPPGATLPWKGFVQSRGSGSTWLYTATSPTSGKWEEAWGVVTDGTPTDSLTRNPLRSWNGTTLGASLVDWQPSDGTIVIYAVLVADAAAALLNDVRATARPGWLPAGKVWTDISGGPTNVVRKYWDGAQDIPLWTINETANTCTPFGALQTGGTVTGTLTINASPAIVTTGAISVNAGGSPAAMVHIKATGTQLMAEQTNNGQQVRAYLKNPARTAFLYVEDSGIGIYDETGLVGKLYLPWTGEALISQDLTVLGNIKASGALRANNDPAFQIYASGAARLFQAAANSYITYDTGAPTWAFVIGGNQRFRVQNDGLGVWNNVHGFIDASGHIVLRAYTTATRPSAAANTNRLIRVTDDVYAPVQVSNGTSWMKVASPAGSGGEAPPGP